MIKCNLILPDKREITVLIRERQYRKLTTKIELMTFWQKIQILFKRK